ncbi:MAG: hypothetical protein JNJ57_12985 [Saprospiraceae bacterium]|nr:hypothetical protein [Saprospiraceae bacterium]
MTICTRIFMLGLLLSTCACTPGSYGDPNRETVTIHVFTDMDVVVNESDNERNINRLEFITKGIKTQYLADEKIGPIECTIHPLYYKTQDKQSVAVLSISPDQLKDVGDVERNHLMRAFNPLNSYQKFKKAKLSGNQNVLKTNKNIWHSVYFFADMAKTSHSSELLIIYYSSMLEGDGGNPEAGMYSFSTYFDPYNHSLGKKLNATEIEKAMSDLDMPDSPICRALTQEKNKLERLVNKKNIRLKLVRDSKDELFDDDSNSDPRILENFWEKFFGKLGIEAEWTDGNDLFR